MRGYCAAVDSYECEAPAGYRTGAGYAASPSKTGLLQCGYCAEAVCSKCSDVMEGRPVCLTHSPEELAFWLGIMK